MSGVAYALHTDQTWSSGRWNGSVQKQHMSTVAKTLQWQRLSGMGRQLQLAKCPTTPTASTQDGKPSFFWCRYLVSHLRDHRSLSLLLGHHNRLGQVQGPVTVTFELCNADPTKSFRKGTPRHWCNSATATPVCV